MPNRLETYKVKEWTVLGRNFFKPPFRVSDALINEARIVYVVNGRSKLYSANEFTELFPGDTLIMKTDNFVNQWLANETDELNQVIVFQLNSALLHHLYEQKIPEWFVHRDDENTSPVIKPQANPLLNAYFESLQVYLDHSRHLAEGLIQIKAKELIHILAQTDASGTVKNFFGNLFNAREYDFQEVIQKNLFKDLNIENLAFLTGMSLSSFKRKFSSIYGTSPNKYIISKRLDKAQTLLNTTTLTISEIAYDCGFSDVSYFSKTFRKYYNSSPSDIRNNQLD